MSWRALFLHTGAVTASRGALVLEHPAAPAAGANLSFTLPGGYLWLLRSMRFTYTASAQVRERVPGATINDQDGAELLRAVGTAIFTASHTAQVTVAPGVEGAGSEAALAVSIAAPELLLPGGWQWRTAVAGIQTEDTITNVRLLFDQYEDRRAVLAEREEHIRAVIELVAREGSGALVR